MSGAAWFLSGGAAGALSVAVPSWLRRLVKVRRAMAAVDRLQAAGQLTPHRAELVRFYLRGGGRDA